MRNYAEELAYWYFRFNGFFLLNNYVSHPGDRDDSSHSDSDLLGVKMPFSKEVIGLNTNEDICKRLSESLNYKSKPNQIVGLICEVKGGENKFELNNANLRSQIGRLGFFGSPEGVEKAINALENESSYDDGTWRIVRIIVCRGDNRTTIPQNWIRFDIETIVDYISNERFANYLIKFGGWDKFDSSLIQFLLRQRNVVTVSRPENPRALNQL
jgi:hypothetical protein